MARRLYRFVWNKRLSAQTLQAGLYRIGQATVERYGVEEWVVAIDPVNFEKPYTHDLEGVSTVYKSSPPDRKGKARLVRGYPALTACVGELIVTMPPMFKLESTFQHARTRRTVQVALGWLELRLPGEERSLWLPAIHDPDLDRNIGLLTNRPILSGDDAQSVFVTWRYRPQIEHTYRLDQEAGIDVEDLRVHTLEPMRRDFFMVLVAAAFLYHLDQSWQPEALHWLRSLGGKLGTLLDLDGLCTLLAGIRAVLVTAATLAFVRSHPFPRPGATCG